MTSTSKITLTRQNISEISANRSFVMLRMGLFASGFDQDSRVGILEAQGKSTLVEGGMTLLLQSTDEIRNLFGS